MKRCQVLRGSCCSFHRIQRALQRRRVPFDADLQLAGGPVTTETLGEFKAELRQATAVHTGYRKVNPGEPGCLLEVRLAPQGEAPLSRNCFKQLQGERISGSILQRVQHDEHQVSAVSDAPAETHAAAFDLVFAVTQSEI